MEEPAARRLHRVPAWPLPQGSGHRPKAQAHEIAELELWKGRSPAWRAEISSIPRPPGPNDRLCHSAVPIHSTNVQIPSNRYSRHVWRAFVSPCPRRRSEQGSQARFLWTDAGLTTHRWDWKGIV